MNSDTSKYKIPMADLGNCLVCGEPIYMIYEDDTYTSGTSERYKESKFGAVHHSCVGGKNLNQLNEEYKKILGEEKEKDQGFDPESIG